MTTRVISEGPAVITWNSQNYYTTGTITLTPDIKLRQMVSAYYGPVDSRVTDKMFTLSFTPFGEMNNNAAKYFPYAVTDIGKLIAPSTDLPLVVWTSTGQKLSFPAAVVTGCPQLLLGTDIGPMGEMTFACMGDLSKADAAADAHFTISAAAISAHSLDPDKAPTPGYKALLDTTEIDSEKGFTFDCGAVLTPRSVNRYGTVNFKLTALQPSIAFTPFGLTEAGIMALWNIQGSGAAQLGGSNKLGKALSVQPAETAAKGITVAFADCQVKSGSMLFGAEDPRHGQYAFVPAVKVTAGVPGALYTVTFPTWA
jgi:hypothetical protein